MALSELVIGKPFSRLPKKLKALMRPGAKVLIVEDHHVLYAHGKAFNRAFVAEKIYPYHYCLAAGEPSKKLQTAAKLYQFLARYQFDRQSWLIALGGGVVGDLTGFVAATYLRGLPYIQVPTTLLAQVDASIGGKTGVDLPEGKNLVGSFHHPKLIWIDPSLLKTLPLTHWRNGLAEVIKYGAIRDAKLFEKLEHLLSRPVTGYSAEWAPIIARCAQIKAEVVAKDPFETRGLRAILNFGHSVGHAIEAATGYRGYLHGEAISIGMFVAGILSEELCGLPSVDRIRLGTLLTKAGLPARVGKPLPRKQILKFLSRDKKVEDGAVKFVLLKRLGEAVSGQSVPSELLAPALAASGL
jgi:3-dehydroquinate synthase